MPTLKEIHVVTTTGSGPIPGGISLIGLDEDGRSVWRGWITTAVGSGNKTVETIEWLKIEQKASPS